MPLYLVRWPDLTASLVRADNESDLLIALDQIDDPSGCTWIEYEGPLFFDFQLVAEIEVKDPTPGDGTVRLLDPAHIHIKGVDRLVAHRGPPLMITTLSEAGYDMVHEIMEYAFPATAAAYGDPTRALDCETLEAAIRTDAMDMLQDSRQSHRRDAATPAEIRKPTAALERFPGLVMEVAAPDVVDMLAGVTATPNGWAPTDNDTELRAALDAARGAWIADRDPDKTRRALLRALLLLDGGRPAAQA